MELNEFAERVVCALERIARGMDPAGEPRMCIVTKEARAEEPCYENLEREELLELCEERGLGVPSKRTYTTTLIKMLKDADAAPAPP